MHSLVLSWHLHLVTLMIQSLLVFEPAALLGVLGPLLRPKPGDVSEPPFEYAPGPVVVGLSGPPPRFGPIVVGKLEGLTELATRLKAPKHCNT